MPTLNSSLGKTPQGFLPSPVLAHALPGRLRFQVYGLTNLRYYAELIEETLQSQQGVTQVRFNPWAASVVVRYRDAGKSQGEWVTELARLLQGAIAKRSRHEIARSPAPQPESQEEPKSNEGEGSSLKLPLLATLLALAAKAWPVPFRSLAAGTLALTALPIAQRAWNGLWVERRLTIDCLDLLALSLSRMQGKLLTPALVITLHELGDLIRERTARATEIQTADLLEAIGHFAWVERDGCKQQIESDRVLAGETVIVYPGEQIPVDGTVLRGKALVDPQQLTGESVPIVAEAEVYVYASTLVRSGEIYIRAERIGQQTRAAASIELLQKAPVGDTRMANYAAKVAERSIVPALVLAGIVLLATRDPARAAAILTLDFVTGIRVSIPTAFLSALNHTTRHGILARSGRTLELLAEIDTVVFDKTGTLTQGKVTVVGVQGTGQLPEERLLQLAAAAEQRLTHPVAEAIARAARGQNIEIPPRGEWNYEVGLGIRAEIEGQSVLVGSERFLRQDGIEFNDPGLEDDVSQIYIACNGEFQGVIQYADPLRPDSAALLEQLQNVYGTDIHLLTGDNQQRATRVARSLNIAPDRVYAEAFPEQKAAIVRQLHRSGKTVAFVGDGLNDSVALAYADVAISFAGGAEVARETADVVLMNNDLSSLLEAIAIAKQTQRLIEQNTVLVVGPNLIALGLATTVGLNPLLATLVHNGSAIAAGMNSLRPLIQHQLGR
ncbi:MAG: heavy metal translocating P-type ATPase [Cyanobacteriota bacterium]|nr:heavy metal translocating P-type ATPase [Cyanobacteriota bacterium]